MTGKRIFGIRRPYGRRISGCRKSGLRHFFEVFIAPLRLRRGQGAMQGNPCYARLFADLTRMSPNPIIASGGCGPRAPRGFSTSWNPPPVWAADFFGCAAGSGSVPGGAAAFGGPGPSAPGPAKPNAEGRGPWAAPSCVCARYARPPPPRGRFSMPWPLANNRRRLDGSGHSPPRKGGCRPRRSDPHSCAYPENRSARPPPGTGGVGPTS